MAIKLIAIDMDGTLLNQRHEVTPEVIAAIHAAQAKGIAIVLATGRPFVGVQSYLQVLQLQRPGQFCITNNGALVQHAENGQCVVEITLSFDDYLYVEKLAQQLGVSFQALSHDSLFTPNKDISPYTIHEASLTGIPLRYRAADEMDTQLTFPKLMMIDTPEKLDRAIEQLPQEAKARYTMVKSAPFYLEVLNNGVSKGSALQQLTERLGLSAQQVMAIGDQENDISMIEFAGTGVAMGNAIDSVKAIAQYVTGANTENGVAQAIEKLAL
ncbi:MAG: Sugar phosphatase YidA [Candidatus Erwinia impunctatus]|nr:Sugar phosphatase YidA [Culicoides impunctatus]